MTAWTDARGVAAFVGIVPGEYTVRYAGAKGADRVVEITLKPGDQSADFVQLGLALRAWYGSIEQR